MKANKCCAVVLLSSVMFTAHADNSVDHSGKASKHSVLASVEGVGSSAVVASAVVSTPFILVAGASAVTASAIDDSVHSHHHKRRSHTHRHQHAPLPISDITITADPAPNKAVAEQKESRHEH